MSIAKIRAALETQLATVAPTIATAYENVPYLPVSGAPYQRVAILPAETQNPTYGPAFRRESGIFQVLLCYPGLSSTDYQQGSGAASAQAELVRAAFPRGSSFVNGGVTVQIDKHPSVAPAIIVGDRYCIPVRVRYYANIPG
jgi:hypothetical protein